MPRQRPFLVKSFEEDHATKAIVGKEKRVFQTLEQILKTGTLKPNTRSFGQKPRLSTTILHDQYVKTYRPQGIIFQTDAKPDYVLPFDLVVLSDVAKVITRYHRIKNDLHVYYNHQLMDGYERFVFKDIASLVRKFSAPEQAWKALNAFRLTRGFPALAASKFRLVQYNEAVFHAPIRIEPVALFGYRPETRALARKHGLRCYRSARQFYERAHTA